MSEKTTAQSQQKESQKATFERAMGENIERIASMFGGVEQASQAIDDGAKMMKDMLGYSFRLQEQWTKVALENSRRATQLMVPNWMA